MALTDEECAELFVDIEATMREQGLQWIVTEVKEAIQTGNIQEIKVNRRKSPSNMNLREFSLHSPSLLWSDKTGVQEWTAVDYSNKERIKMLLQALAEYIRDLSDLISHLPDLGVLSEDSHYKIRLVSLATDEGEPALDIVPNLQLPDQEFLKELDTIIERI